MNYIKHLAAFFEKVSNDDRLNPTHISMYVSLFQFWNACRFSNPITISRGELMKVSKISAKATYHKCIRELNDFGYLHYLPSFNPFKGSLVYMFNFQSSEMNVKNEDLSKIETSKEQVLYAHHTKIDTSTDQAQEPYINSNKHYKQNASKHIKNRTLNTSSENDLVYNQKEILATVKKENLRQKKKEEPSRAPVPGPVNNTTETQRAFKPGTPFTPPDLVSIQAFFNNQQFPSIEAEKFYHHFQSNGWLVGGKAIMHDWKAAASKWMLNVSNFNINSKPSISPKPNHLHVPTNKNYNEPL